MVSDPTDQAIEEYLDNGAITVLLVQTDDVLLGTLRQLLENDGYRVLFANSGEAALNACHQQPGIIQFLISDVALGQLSGFDLAIELARVQSQVTVVFTATAPTALQASNCDICRTASAHFLPKPFTYSQLRDRLVQLSTGAGYVTLEWLLHSYDEVKPHTGQKPIPAQPSEEEHPIALHVKVVEGQDVLLLKGLIQQAKGRHSSCVIEPQVRAFRTWHALRMSDLKSMGNAVVRLLVRPELGKQLEQVLQGNSARKKKRSSTRIEAGSCRQESKEIAPQDQVGKKEMILSSTSSNSSPESGQESKKIVPLCELEKEAIISALAALNGDKALTAEKLGIGKTTLYRKLREYECSGDIPVPWLK